MNLIDSPSKRLIYLIFVFGVFSCSSYPETPSEVVEQFARHLSNGECNAAMNLCEGNAKKSVQRDIDAGCGPYKTTVDSAICTITNNTATCFCYESRDGITGMGFPYQLEKINDQWKIVECTKDASIEDPSQDSVYLNELDEDLKLMEEVEKGINERDSLINSILD